MAKATAPTTAIAAGVKTPASGAYSDPAQVGQMIKSMYPQYANMDAATIGQRWIDVHTPQPSAAPASAGAGTTDVLQAPTDTTLAAPTQTSPTQNTPDLSGLSQFASPIQQQTPAKPQLKVDLSNVSGGNTGNQLLQPTQSTNTPWIGSQIAGAWNNFWKTPKLDAKPLNQLGF